MNLTLSPDFFFFVCKSVSLKTNEREI